MSAGYQIAKEQRLLAQSTPLSPAEKAQRLRHEVDTATNDEDRADWERAYQRFILRNPEVLL